MSKRFKFPFKELTVRWEWETADSVVGGYCYRGKRVFTCVAKTKEEVLEAMKGFRENSCVEA